MLEPDTETFSRPTYTKMPGLTSQPAGEDIYHVILTSSHFKRDPNSEIQKVRVCGTYTSIKSAKAEAHRTLFDAGYEREWFKVFDARTHDTTSWKHGDGVIVYAEAPEGETFTVSIYTAKDTLGVKSNDLDKIEIDLYHILQTTIFYDKDASGGMRETSIQGTFKTYGEARAAATSLLLNKEDGMTKGSWDEYDELPVGERDGEYGENVVVHAIGSNGENVVLSVVKEQELEALRVLEAAMRLR
jgi:hypothetical protein